MQGQLEQERKPSGSEVESVALDNIKLRLKQLEVALAGVREVGPLLEGVEVKAQNLITQFAVSMKMGKLDEDAIRSFFKQPYVLEPAVNPDGKAVPNTWRLSVPRFVPLQVGYLETQDEAWNHFRVNRFMDFFGEIPDFIKKQIGWIEPPDLKLAGEELLGSPEALEMAWKEFKPYLKRQEGKLLVTKEHAYDLMVGLLKKGVKPFSDKPVDPADLVERKCDYVLRDYQEEIWKVILRKSTVGVFIPPSTGKTVIGSYAATHLKPPILIVVPSLTLKEQWIDRIQGHTDLKVGEEVFVATYYEAIKKFSNMEFTLKVYDEVHHLPANFYIKLSWIRAKYVIGLSGTPYREDNAGRDIGGEEMIFALTGEPTGLAWQHFKELKLIKSPTCYVWVEKSHEAKMKRLNELLRTPKKTIIFSDSIELGKTVAARYSIPFVFGESKDRLKTLKEAQTAVVSRVGDEGVSLPDIERVIEISWLWGSRRQELQRFTRLLHGHETAAEGEAHVIMTYEEWVRDKKRFYSVMDRGFKIRLNREGVSEKAIEVAERAKPIRARNSTQAGSNPTPEPAAPPPSSGVIAGIMDMPGVKSRMERMTKPQRTLFEFLLKNDGTFIRKDKLQFVLNYSSMHSMEVNIEFPAMVKAGWIEQQRMGGMLAYRTNIQSKIG